MDGDGATRCQGTVLGGRIEVDGFSSEGLPHLEIRVKIKLWGK